MSTTFGSPTALTPGITWEKACTINGRAVYGYRLSCAGCGTVEENVCCSSITAQDAPFAFRAEHRDCGPTVMCDPEAARIAAGQSV